MPHELSSLSSYKYLPGQLFRLALAGIVKARRAFLKTILSEMNEAQKDKHSLISYLCGI